MYMNNVSMRSAASEAPSSGGAGDITSRMQQELDRNAFLKLLISQMQNQDPMKPMEDREFIAQLAQFSSLEQMEQMNQTMQLLAFNAAGNSVTSMIGHTVTAQSPTDEAPIVGRVDAVEYEGGIAKLIIGDQTVDPGWVTRIE